LATGRNRSQQEQHPLKVLALQQAKQVLVQNILGDKAFARSLSREDLAFPLAED